MTKKKLTRSKLVKKLDKVFSEYIRRSHADKNGYIKCCTCGQKRHWKDNMDNGHFVPRNHTRTRWDERNVAPQCRGCNRFGGGKPDEFAIYLMKKYGNNILQEINQAKHAPYKIYTTEIETMIEDYKEKLKELDK